MRICIYEDSGYQWLEPITLTRPSFALWCGAERLCERQRRTLRPTELGFWVRPALTDLWKHDAPGHPINDSDWVRERSTVWINGRWLPEPEVTIDAATPHVGQMNDQIAYAVLPSGSAPTSADLDAWFGGWKERLPSRTVGGAMVGYLWDVVDHNAIALKQDGDWFRTERGARPIPTQVAVEGPAHRLVIADGATVEPFVFAGTRGGPVMIDRGAVVHSFSRLEGPCYVGPGSWIVGAKLRAGSSIGPICRIGGEIEASIVQGYTNKYHDGFLGHSYLGEWVNIGAGTHTSDLRNDNEMIRVHVNGQRVATGRNKVGSYIGDHTKTGLSALLNTGSTIGAFASVLPSGSLLPTLVPSFCQVHHGQVQEVWDLRKVFSTTARVMQRRGRTLTDTLRDFYYDLFDTTAKARQKTLRTAETRRLRKSI